MHRTTAAPRTGPARVRIAAVRTAAGLAVGAGLVLIVLRLVNVSAVVHRLQHLNAGFAVLCGASFLAAFAVRGLRWRCLLRPCQVSIRHAVAIYQVAIFLNWLLPVRGGEVAMSLLLRRTDGIPVSRSLAAVSMDKAMDLLPAVVLIAVLPFVPVHLSGPLWFLLVSTLAVIALGAGVFFLAVRGQRRGSIRLARSVAALVPQRIRDRAGPFVAEFANTLLDLVHRPRQLLTAAAYTAVAVSLDSLSCLAAFRAVGVVVAVPVVLYGYTLFNLAFILPSPPGQVGSNELIGLLIFSGTFGISRSGVTAMFLFSHPLTSILMTCIGMACLSAMGLTMRATLRLAREDPDGHVQAQPEWPAPHAKEFEDA